MPRRPVPPLLVATALFVVALAVRVAGLGAQSLWADEGVTWWYATHGTFKDTVYAEPNHPPGWYLATRAWLSVFPASEASIRMPAAILGAASVVLAWLLARRLSPGPTARWVALLAAVNPYWIAQSQEARMYAALLAESLGLTLLYLRWRDRGGRGAIVAYGVLAAVALHTHYYALWPLLGHGAHAAFTAWRARREGRRLPVLPLVLAQAAAAASFLPWLLHLGRAWRGIGGDPIEPVSRLLEALWRIGAGPGIAALDAARAEAGQGGALRADGLRVAFAAVLWFVPIGLGVRAVLRERAHRALLATSLALPLAAVLLVCLRWPLAHERHLVFLAPWLLWLAVVGARSTRGAARAALLCGLVLVHVAGAAAYFAGDREPVRTVLAGGVPYAKERWRDAHEIVAAHARPGDVVLLHARFPSMVWDFYEREGRAPAFALPPRPPATTRAPSASELLETVPGIREASQVFLVTSHAGARPKGQFRSALFRALDEAWGAHEVAEDLLLPAQTGLRLLHVVRR